MVRFTPVPIPRAKVEEWVSTMKGYGEELRAKRDTMEEGNFRKMVISRDISYLVNDLNFVLELINMGYYNITES